MPKLRIGDADDLLEKKADQRADEVLRIRAGNSGRGLKLQRMPAVRESSPASKGVIQRQQQPPGGGGTQQQPAANKSVKQIEPRPWTLAGMSFPEWIQREVDEGRRTMVPGSGSVVYYATPARPGALVVLDIFIVKGSSIRRSLYTHPLVAGTARANPQILKLQRFVNSASGLSATDHVTLDRNNGDSWEINSGGIPGVSLNKVDQKGFAKGPDPHAKRPLLEIGYYNNGGRSPIRPFIQGPGSAPSRPPPRPDPGTPTKLEHVEVYDFLNGQYLGHHKRKGNEFQWLPAAPGESHSPAHAGKTPRQIERDELGPGWSKNDDGFHKLLPRRPNGSIDTTLHPWFRESADGT